jgi:glycosyltransferase involved in cell wall biosynthesis
MNILANDNILYHASQRGVVRVYTKTIEALAERFGRSVVICSPRRYPQFPVRQYRILRLPGSVGNVLNDYARTHDVMTSIVAAVERPTVLYNAYYGAVVTRAAQVFTVYDMIFELFPEYFPESNYRNRKLIREKRRCIQRADLILAISKSTANDIQTIYPEIDPAKIVVTPLGVDGIFFTDARSLASVRPYLLFAGTRAVYKNFVALLQAFRQSGLAKVYDLRVFSPGSPGFDMQEQNFIQQYGLEGVVHLTANPGDAIVRDLYASAEALVYPSLYEGFGLSVLEAMACGTLVAASNISSLPEVGGDIALYFDPRSVDSIAATLVRIADMPAAERQDRIARGRAHAQQFTWEFFKQRTSEAFRRFIDNGFAMS